MEFKEFLNLIKRKIQTIFTIIFVVTMMVVIVSLSSSLKYSVVTRLLVIQDSSNTDVYSLSRSNEYLGNLFSQVVYSSSFYDQVLSSRYNIEKNYFSGDYGKQLKKWHKTVKTSTQGDTGIIEVEIYHPQVNEAQKIALAVNDILINNNKDYQSNQNVKVKILDQPLASTYPTKPNVLINIIVSIFLALIFSLFYIYVLPEPKYNLNLFGNTSFKKKKNKNQGILEKFHLETESVHKNVANNKSATRYIPIQSTIDNNEIISNNKKLDETEYINENSQFKGNIRNIISR